MKGKQMILTDQTAHFLPVYLNRVFYNRSFMYLTEKHTPLYTLYLSYSLKKKANVMTKEGDDADDAAVAVGGR